MNDEGVYMFIDYRGTWIPDTPAQRRTVVERLRAWNAFSNSSPIEGIVEAVRTYRATHQEVACTCSVASSGAFDRLGGEGRRPHQSRK